MLNTPKSSRNLFGSVVSPSFLGSVGKAAKQLVPYGASAASVGSGLYLVKAHSTPKNKKRKRNKKKGSDKVRFAESNGTGQGVTIRPKSRRRTKSKGSIKKRVAKLEKNSKLNYAKSTFKFDYAYQVASLTNVATYSTYHWMAGADINSTIDEMPYVDPTTPSTEKQTNMSVLPQPLKLQMKFVGQATIRNNYLYPVDIAIYIVRPKQATADSPATDIEDGITEKANLSVDNWAQYNLFPSDSKLFTQRWKTLKTQKLRLQSGDEITVSHSEKFTYDQKLYAQFAGEGSTYTKQYSRVLLIRICGIVAHEALDSTKIGIAPSKVDVLTKRMYTVSRPSEYPMQTLQQTKSATVNALTTAVIGVSSAETENSPS